MALEKGSLTKHDKAWEKVTQFYQEPMVWELVDAGFVNEDQRYQRQPFTKDGFIQLCLKWMVLPQPYQSRRNQVSIAEEVATELPRLSSARKIKEASSGSWGFIGLSLDDIFSKPTPPYRHNMKMPGVNHVIYRDEFLYRLILAHLEDDVRQLATRDGLKPDSWILDLTQEVGILAEKRFPGLWDHSPLEE